MSCYCRQWRHRCLLCLGAVVLFVLAQVSQPHYPASETTFGDLVLWDTEQTSWEGSNARRWKGFIPGTSTPETRELLQLSALKATLVQPHGHRTGWRLRHGGSFNVLVRPTINPVLSSYVTQLTNITQDQVNRTGVSFLEAVGRLHRFAEGGALLSYGNDWSVVHDNFELLGEAPPWPGWGADMLDVKPLFIAAGLNLSGLSSGTVHRAVGISGDGHVHDASWDVESLFLTLQAVLDRPSIDPAHAGASVGHALRRAIVERARPAAAAGPDVPGAAEPTPQPPKGARGRDRMRSAERAAPGVAWPTAPAALALARS